MKQTVLGQPLARARKRNRMRALLCVLAVVLTLALNLVLALTASEKTNRLFCLLNIAADVICGVFVIRICTVKLAPQRVLCRLARRPMADCTGTVKSVSEQTVRYMDMDCLALTVDDRKLFLPAASMDIRVGEAYHFRLASNIIMEAEQ